MFKVLIYSIFMMIEVGNLLGRITDLTAIMIIVVGLRARYF